MTSRTVGRWLPFAITALVVLAGTTFVAAGQTQAPTIETFEYTGDGSVSTPQEQLYLWRAASHSFEVTLAAGDGGGDYEICLQTRPADEDDTTGLACRGATVEAGGETAVTVEVDEWPANLTGRQEVTAVATQVNDSSGEPADRRSLTVTVLERDDDPDEDGLTNEEEAGAGTGFFTADTDGDGLTDGQEVNVYGSDPNKTDTDGDGLDDGEEVNQYQTNPTSADTDDDGLSDSTEVEEYRTNPNKADTDDDGLTDGEEVNTYGTDPNRADTDDDGLSDSTEVEEHGSNPKEADTDDDGLTDGQEVNVYETDPTSADTDGDGLDDGDEVNQYQTDPNRADTDDDGLSDGDEVEKHETNPNKADTDGDGLDDGEEVEGGTDPLTPDADGAAGRFPFVPREAVGGIFVIGALVLLGLFVFFRRSDAGGVVGRLRTIVTPDASVDDGDGGSTGEPAGVAGVTPDGATPPIPTNQNRVLALLGENGGRMLQSDIVDATDWSKSKVSRVLSDMDEEGEIEKIDVGKGNLIALPEVAPPETRSPLDDDEE